MLNRTPLTKLLSLVDRTRFPASALPNLVGVCQKLKVVPDPRGTSPKTKTHDESIKRKANTQEKTKETRKKCNDFTTPTKKVPDSSSG